MRPFLSYGSKVVAHIDCPDAVIALSCAYIERDDCFSAASVISSFIDKHGAAVDAGSSQGGSPVSVLVTPIGTEVMHVVHSREAKPGTSPRPGVVLECSACVEVWRAHWSVLWAGRTRDAAAGACMRRPTRTALQSR